MNICRSYNLMAQCCLFIILSVLIVGNESTFGLFTIKNLRGRDLTADTEFEYDLLNQTSRVRSNIFTSEKNSDVLVKIAYRSFPKRFREFTISAIVQMNDTNGGSLFSILNPLGTVIQLGLMLVPANRYIYNITLIYTDAKLHLDSQHLAVFQVPAFKNETTIAIKVFLHRATLYLNCHEVKSIVVNIDPVEIKIDTDSRLYVGSDGPNLHNKFDGQINHLKIYNDPDAIGKICFGQVLTDRPMLFTMPPIFYATPSMAAPTFPSIPYLDPSINDNDNENDNYSFTDMNNSLSTAAPKATFYLRLAALNEPYAGNLHGTRGADFLCYRQAGRAGIAGSFKAFLSTRIQSLQGLISYNHWDVPIANIKGEMIFRSWKDLFDTNGELSFQSPRLYSFNGKDVLNDSTWPRKQIWHGSNINGDKSIESFCDTWESASPQKFGMAGSLSNRKLINNEQVWCRNELVTLCIETIPREQIPLN